MLPDSVAVGYAGDVVGNRSGRALAGASLEVRGQELRLCQERAEQIGYDAARLGACAQHARMAIKVGVQKALELPALRQGARAEPYERRCAAHGVDRSRGSAPDVFGAGADEVGHQGVDHAPYRFVYEPAAREPREFAQGRLHVAADDVHPDEALQLDEPGAQAVVDVVVVIGDLVGEVGDLRLERGPLLADEPLTDVPERARVLARAMLEYPFARLEGEIEPVERAVALLQQVHDAQALQVVL